MSSEEQKAEMLKTDATDEGRKTAMMDIDRMVNEGMAGGRIHRKQIEEATDMPEE